MASDNDSDIGDMLDDLLANADESSPKKNTLRELNFNFLDSQENATSAAPKSSKDNVGGSLVRDADADSSDDEDKRDFESQNYSDCGRDLKNLLKKENTRSVEKLPPRSEKRVQERPVSSSSSLDSLGIVVPKSKTSSDIFPAKAKDVYSDPVFGLRLVKPLISSAQLVERMRGRTAVTVSRVKSHVATENTRDDWVVAGVLINRSATKTSQKGSQYCIWKLSDLSEKLSSVSVFLFSGAYKLFWKTTTGTVVGVLNPSVMESRDDADEATLSVDNAQKIMILGNSRDMGKCKSTKKNGEPCSNIVNLSRCEYCVYHVKQEYGKASRRADIQSNASGRGFSSSLGQKKKAPLAGIYAQGLNQNFTPVLAKRNQKLYEKDSARLALLKGATVLPAREAKIENPEDKKRKACAVELTTHQVKKDLERLNKLRGWNVGGQQMNFVKPLEASGLNPANASSPVSVKTRTSAASASSPKNSSLPSQSSKSSRLASISSESQKPRIAAISSPKIEDGVIDFSEPASKKSSSSLNSKTSRISSISPESQKPRIASMSSPKMATPLPGSGVRNGSANLSEPTAKNSNSPSQNSKTSRIASISSPNVPVPRLGSGVDGIIDFSEPVSKKSSSSLHSKTSRISSISPESQKPRIASMSSPKMATPLPGSGVRDGSANLSEPTAKNSNSPSQNSKTSRIASISSPNVPVPRLGSGVDGIIDFSEPVSKKSSSSLNSKTSRISSISPESQKPRIASMSSPKMATPLPGSGARNGSANLSEPTAKNSNSPSQNSKTSRIASISSPNVPVPRLGSGVDGIIDFSEPVSKKSSSSLNSKTSRIASISPESQKPRIASMSSPKMATPLLGSGVRDGSANLSEPTAKNSNSPSQNSKTSRIASISSPNVPVPRLGSGVDGIIDFSEPVSKKSSSSLNSKTSRIAPISPESQKPRVASISFPNVPVPRLGSVERDDFFDPGAKNSSTPSLNSNTSRIPSISSPSLPVPRLGAGLRNGSIDFSEPITKRHVTSARLNAMRWIKENGNLKQSNPNKIRESKEKKVEAGAKRRREVEEAEEESQRAAKKLASGIGDKFKEIMEAKSAHVDLVEKSQDEEKEKYFEKLEIKERMEEKMMTTFKVDCKAVKCLICKYTSFSASDLCKEQRHPLRVIDAVKSFFKCSDCGNRTVSLDRIPSYSCKKCSGSHWVRAAMMDEKKSDIVGAKLSIRGGEEKFIGSVANDANINLCVPDSGTGDS